tara:strand:+ start:2594 stop:3604 length:1011 start_codon:yes stop_codon:yes gene_type:complete
MIKVLTTLGPTSLNKKTVEGLEQRGVSLFRINLSHTNIEEVDALIDKIRSWSGVPICIDSEGAQVRNGSMVSESVKYGLNNLVSISRDKKVGNEKIISLTPASVFDQLSMGDEIRIDFNSVCLKVIKLEKDIVTCKVIHEGHVGSNKAVTINKIIHLPAITPKDEAAFRIGIDKGIENFALSFTNRADDVRAVRKIIGEKNLIAKIESIEGVLNLKEILPLVQQILIDRGDLSREVSIEKIPFLQRRIISFANKFEVPVYVATNLLESMTVNKGPTRAEANDVASTLLMGARGLVLAAETAIGKYPTESVDIINAIIREYSAWSPKLSLKKIIEGS